MQSEVSTRRTTSCAMFANARLQVMETLPWLNLAAAIEMEQQGASPFWARIKQAQAILEDALKKHPAAIQGAAEHPSC